MGEIWQCPKCWPLSRVVLGSVTGEGMTVVRRYHRFNDEVQAQINPMANKTPFIITSGISWCPFCHTVSYAVSNGVYWLFSEGKDIFGSIQPSIWGTTNTGILSPEAFIANKFSSRVGSIV